MTKSLRRLTMNAHTFPTSPEAMRLGLPHRCLPLEVSSLPAFARAAQVAPALLGKPQVADEGPVLERHPARERAAMRRGKLFLRV